nr:transglutaminase family protein [Planctomycetota bacterium]
AERSGDCGGLCIALAAALRANGVPARLLAGRWATSALPEHRVDDVPYLQQHVKLEFHCQGIGWVPCDPASGVLHDRGDGLRFFASDPEISSNSTAGAT